MCMQIGLFSLASTESNCSQGILIFKKVELYCLMGLPIRLAGTAKGDHSPPVFGGEDGVGIGPLGSGNAPRENFARGFGGISAVFVEVRGEYVGFGDL